MSVKRILSGLLALMLLLGNVPVTAFASEAEPLAAPIVLTEEPIEAPAEVVPADTTAAEEPVVEPSASTKAAAEPTVSVAETTEPAAESPLTTESVEETTAPMEEVLELPQVILAEEAGQAGTMTVDAFQSAVDAAIAAGADENGFYSYELTQDLTVDTALTLDLPENFVLYVNGVTLTVAEGASLTLASGSMEFNNSTVTVNGSLTVHNGAALFLQNGSTMDVAGTLTNYGWFHVGFYKPGTELSTAGQINILSGGAMNNYSYLNICPYETLYADNGEIRGTSGGNVSLEGTLNACYDDTTCSFIDLRGIMNITNGGKLLVPNCEGWMLGNFDVSCGTLNVDGGDVSAVPKSYIAVHEEEGGVVTGMDRSSLKVLYTAYSNEALLDYLTRGSCGYHSTHVNAHGNLTLTQDVQIAPDVRFSLTVQPTFDDNGNMTGGSLTLADGVDLTLNNSMLYVNSKLILTASSDPENNPTMLQLNDGTVAEIRGTVENHGSILVGIWNDHNKDCSGGLVICEEGTLDNYGYIQAYAHADMYENGELVGRSGGFFHIYGILNILGDENSVSCVDVYGDLGFYGNAKMVVNNADGYFKVYNGMWLDNDVVIPDDYIWLASQEAIETADFVAQLEEAIDSGETYFELNQPLVLSEDLVLELPENFDLNFRRPVQLNEGAQLELKGGMVEFNESALIVDGTLMIHQDTRLFLNCVSLLEVNGTLNNYGSIFVGEWVWADSESSAGEITVTAGGTLNNYNYINVNPFQKVPTDGGGDPGKSGGDFNIYGTLNAYRTDSTQSYLAISGNAHFYNGSSMVLNYAMDGMNFGFLEVLENGSLTVDSGADLSSIPDGYIAVQADTSSYTGLEDSSLAAFFPVFDDEKLADLLKTTNSPFYLMAIVARGEHTLAEDIAVAPDSNILLNIIGSLTITEGGSLTMNDGRLYVNGELTIEEGGALWLNDWTTMYVNGNVTNHGWLHVGIWMSSDKDGSAADLTIGQNGHLENTGYLNIHTFGDSYDENGNVVGKSGGMFFVGGTVSVSGTGFIEVNGEMIVEEGAYVTDENLEEGGVGTMINPTGHLENNGGNFGGEGVLWAMSTVEITNNTSTGRPKLTWDEVKDAKSYQIYRSTTNKEGSFILQSTNANLYYNDTKAAVGKRYYYRVRAVLEDSSIKKHSTWSNGFDEPITAVCVLAKPAGLKVTNDAATGKPVISWKAVTGATKYQIYYSTKSTGTFRLLQTTTGLNHTHAKAVAGTKYYYKVKAIYGSNPNANSAMTGWYACTCDLARPTGVQITSNATTGKNVISWNKVDGAARYQVYYSTTQNGTYKLLMTTKNTTHTHNGGVAGQKYFYKVKALYSSTTTTHAANSALSGYASRVCDLAKPSSVKVTQDTATGKNKISWAKVTDASKYQVWYSTTGKVNSFKLLMTTSKVSHVHKGGAAGTRYYYKVLAVHSVTAANSAYSNIVNRISQ